MNNEQLQRWFTETTNKIVDDAMSQTDIMSIGEVIECLECEDPNTRIVLSDGRSPGDLSSYRGYYRFLAIETQGETRTVGDFLRECREAIGATFTGYKGGDYVMDRQTLLWVSEYGCSSGDGVVGIESGKPVVIRFANVEGDL